MNLHLLLYSSPSGNDFLKAITPPNRAETQLRAARDEVRDALRNAISQWDRFVKHEEFLVIRESGQSPRVLRPKFRMQGSFVYRTLNDPAQKPPQEMDLDDGLFLPVSFLTANGQSHPAVVSQGLFRLVEEVLDDLCKRNGWTLDRSKPSCVRVKLPGHAHVDVALYSIPDQEFDQLSRSLLAERTIKDQTLYEQIPELEDWLYRKLVSSQIMLAHREEGWKPSDPRELENWFNDKVARHGAVLRRVCRYLKAWRDYQWKECKLSSIALMACAVRTVDSLESALPVNRDDLALELVAQRLGGQLQDKIPNPVVQGQYLDEGWTSEMRRDCASRAQVLANAVTAAIRHVRTAEEAIEALRGVLGPRIPGDASLVRVEDETRKNVASSDGALTVLTSGLLRDRAQRPGQVVKQEGERRYA